MLKKLMAGAAALLAAVSVYAQGVKQNSLTTNAAGLFIQVNPNAPFAVSNATLSAGLAAVTTSPTVEWVMPGLYYESTVFLTNHQSLYFERGVKVIHTNSSLGLFWVFTNTPLLIYGHGAFTDTNGTGTMFTPGGNAFNNTNIIEADFIVSSNHLTTAKLIDTGLANLTIFRCPYFSADSTVTAMFSGHGSNTYEFDGYTYIYCNGPLSYGVNETLSFNNAHLVIGSSGSFASGGQATTFNFAGGMVEGSPANDTSCTFNFNGTTLTDTNFVADAALGGNVVRGTFFLTNQLAYSLGTFTCIQTNLVKPIVPPGFGVEWGSNSALYYLTVQHPNGVLIATP